MQLLCILPFGILCLSGINKMHLTLWYAVCKHYVGSVDIGGYGDLSECCLGVFRELCPVGFLAVCESSSVVLQSVVMSYVDCGDDG